ncbi:hypothetical protein PO909_005357 [Leuciscus waleckii]
MLCGNCSSLSSEAWRDARPNQGTSRPLRHVPPKWAWSRPINTARRQLLSDFSSFKQSTRIAGAGEEAAPSEREHLQRDESLKSLAAPPSLPSCCSIRRYILSLLLCFMYVCVLAAATHTLIALKELGSRRQRARELRDQEKGRLQKDAPFPDHAALALADGDCPHCELVTAYGDSEDSPGILLRDCSSAPPNPQSLPVRPLALPAWGRYLFSLCSSRANRAAHRGCQERAVTGLAFSLPLFKPRKLRRSQGRLEADGRG